MEVPCAGRKTSLPIRNHCEKFSKETGRKRWVFGIIHSLQFELHNFLSRIIIRLQWPLVNVQVADKCPSCDPNHPSERHNIAAVTLCS